MDEINNLPHLDENKNSSTLDNHVSENVEISVSPLTYGRENITPELVFQSPALPQSNILEVNSNTTFQSPKNFNTSASETEDGIAKLEVTHDTANGSILGETIGSYKSCNGSVLEDVSNSFKSLNGSYVIETASPTMSVKALLDETIMKILSPTVQTNANVNLKETDKILNGGLSFNSANSELMVEDICFTENKSGSSVENVLDTTVELPLPNSGENIKETIENAEKVLNNTSSLASNQSVSLSESNILNDALPNQVNKDELPKVLDNSGLDGVLAAFSTLKLEDTAVNLSQSNEATKDVQDSSNLMGFMNVNQPIDDICCKVHIQTDSLTAVDNIDKNTAFHALSQFNEPSGGVTSTIIPESCSSVLHDNKNADCQTLSQFDEPSGDVTFTIIPEAFASALQDNKNADFQTLSQFNEPSGDVTSTIIPEAFASALHDDDKNSDFQSLSQFDEPSGDVTPTIIPEAFASALRDDPFDLKNIEFNKSPSDDFIFKVPETPVDAENEEFTDAVQFFKDPTSFQFLENIKTSPTEGNVPRSSLYIKFDPLHTSFPRNPKSADVLQALKNETGLEPNMQYLNVSARESLGNILISFDSPRKTGCQEPKSPVLVAPAKLYTEEELHQLLNVNELTNQEMLLKKQREMEEELARKEQEMKGKAEEKDKKIAQLENLLKSQCVLLEEFVGISETVSEKNKSVIKKIETMEEENIKLKGDVKTLTEDLQSVETTFADFHKRYEQCKSMLKTLKDNEEILKAKLKEIEQAYQELQDGTQEALEKASSEATSVKKTSEAQAAVLKAQLKKAELKISSLESDIKKIKIENSQLGGICDDLMEKVGKS